MFILDNNIVRFSDQAMLLPEVNDLFINDKHERKNFFNDTAIYIYFMYKKDSIYHLRTPEKRAELIIQKHLPTRKWTDFEENKRVKPIIDFYIDNQYTPMEQLYEGIKTDIDTILKRLKNIPYEKKLKVELYVEVLDTEGQKIQQKVYKEIMFDNSKEKLEAMKYADSLIEYEKKIKQKIFEEKKDTKRSRTRIFGNKENHIIPIEHAIS
jgi:hypothetical protein